MTFAIPQAAPTAPTLKFFEIKQRGKVVAKLFGSYEEARRLVRARIRASVKAKRAVRKGLWDEVSRNPTSIKAYGYKIVAA